MSKTHYPGRSTMVPDATDPLRVPTPGKSALTDGLGHQGPASGPGKSTLTGALSPAAETNYLAGYTSLGGTNIAQLNTSKAEADILNGIRHADHRFDPVWLSGAQKALGVAATGAFNTETLRALLKRQPRLDAGAILRDQGGLLTGLCSGAPFIETPSGFGDLPREAVGATKADRAAARLGYTDYAAYHRTLVPITFLGVPISPGARSSTSVGLAHPHLAERLRVAEAFLRARHPGTDEDVIRAVGWNKEGVAAYEDGAKYGQSHFHTMGLAIDIDVHHNPYIFTGTHGAGKARESEQWWMDLFETHSGYAATLFGGEKVSAAILNTWAARMSTDELHARVAATSAAFAQYLALADESDDTIIARFTAAGVAAGVASAALPDVHNMPRYFHGFMSRRQATTFTNHSQELLVALRDVAGLAWGGAEMSSNENGDFMHFDCRQDGFGSALQRFNFPS